MTDRFNTLTVVLENDMREDDAEGLIVAIQQMRGVLSVAGDVSNQMSHMAEERAKREYWDKLKEVIYPG
jgi:hypothetical protein